MPMCDIFIPAGALEPEAERKLVARVSELLVEHEMRRIVDLMPDPDSIKASAERANSIAWMFVHRTETYVAGQPVAEPHYKFEITIPEGMIDDRFAPAINRDIFAAVKEAEGGKHKHLPRRVWIHIHELRDGCWGAGDRTMHFENIVDYVAPGLAAQASQRFGTAKREQAAALVALAGADR
ncbi:hypothetical protein [Sphingomonas lenta]|uniref:hypothetical protein n=1 Tax=Sphingomonas lenta TaxID=1141887 RepID=UPI0015950816|nr:hypothetical protein [Sphingomonas lenta]